ncbi:hypothetical protein V6N00_00875 [Tersicoccus sp. MR15.9]|uniref:hypothetical protein n=1 Tax=Tersicoccus mangrovi TaxID=3121635 RepID=UPI002FE634C2
MSGALGAGATGLDASGQQRSDEVVPDAADTGTGTGTDTAIDQSCAASTDATAAGSGADRGAAPDPADAEDTPRPSAPSVSALRLDRILAAEDDPHGWGGRGDETAPEHDRWLREQRPPHWG